MSVSLSGIGAVGKEKLISSCSNGEPNWSFIPTKGKSSKTQTEFVSEIRELARRAATATNKTESLEWRQNKRMEIPLLWYFLK